MNNKCVCGYEGEFDMLRAESYVVGNSASAHFSSGAEEGRLIVCPKCQTVKFMSNKERQKQSESH